MAAELDETLSKQMWAYDISPIIGDCPLNSATAAVGGAPDNSGLVWSAFVRFSYVVVTNRFTQHNVYLTFDTSVLGSVTVTAAELLLSHVDTNTNATAELYGGVQPIFGASVDNADFFKGTSPLDSESMPTIVAQDYAKFDVSAAQVNLGGYTQFKLAMNEPCPWTDDYPYAWTFYSPHAPAGQRPVLSVTYTP